MHEIDTGDRDQVFVNAVNWMEKILIAASESILEFADGELTEFSSELALGLTSK